MSVRAEIAAAIAKGNLADDPLRHFLTAIAAGVDDFQRIVDQARQPLSPEALDRIARAAAAGANQNVISLARAGQRRATALITLALVVALAAGFVAGWVSGHG